MEAIMLATKNGGELMRMEVGQIREGLLADMLLVDGDPLKDLSILVGPHKLAMIMKDGQMHKDPSLYSSAERIAAE
jgi:imidazolonepropionase-like amidohydrolase